MNRHSRLTLSGLRSAGALDTGSELLALVEKHKLSIRHIEIEIDPWQVQSKAIDAGIRKVVGKGRTLNEALLNAKESMARATKRKACCK